MARVGEEGASQIIPVLDGRVQRSFSWTSLAVVCGPGSTVLACLGLPEGRRKRGEPAEFHRTNVIIYFKNGRK